MPLYTYRREDGSTFELRQHFTDSPLITDPETGQKVQRVVQAAGVIFKGSGFYVNDSKGARNPASPKAETKHDGDARSEGKTDAKPEAKAEAKTEAAPAAAPSTTAAD